MGKMNAIYRPRTGQTKGLIFISDSLGAGQGAMGVYTAGLGATASVADQVFDLLGAPAALAIFNMSQPAITASAYYTNRANVIPALLAAYPAISQWDAVINLGANDLRGGVTATALLASVTNLVSYLAPLVRNVAACTVTANGEASWDATKEGHRTSFNASVVGGSTGADAAVDFAGIAALANPNDTTYFGGDKIHPKARGYEQEADLLLSTLVSWALNA